jgi:hypothetical protein
MRPPEYFAGGYELCFRNQIEALGDGIGGLNVFPIAFPARNRCCRRRNFRSGAGQLQVAHLFSVGGKPSVQSERFIF